MWNDIETTQDLLNFKVVADTAAQMIIDGDNQPVSIGVSGGWGVGKSSLVKMIGESIKQLDTVKQLDTPKKYIFIEFNAWLYQGFDDARMALLQKVADRIMEEAKSKKTYIDKAKEFGKRLNLLRVAKFAVPIAAGLITGNPIVGSIGTFLGSLGTLLSKNEAPTSEEITQVKDSYNKIAPDVQKLLKDKEIKSIPKEISAFRELFQNLLEKLDLNLIVLVDDLDRCLPNTAISTLEAMRLLLFIPRTAFIIAADEEMIRNAVRIHFGNDNISNSLVTSYFDKLIQIPIRVPRLGTNEVKGYLILLLADLAQRRGTISLEEKQRGHDAIVLALKKTWGGALTKKTIENAYEDAASKIIVQIELADQIANIMATNEHIAGNPRLIKRFLNNLVIRQSVAKAQGMSIPFEELVKLQLFERCATPAAFEYLVKQVGESENGKPDFLQKLENQTAKGEELTVLPDSWKPPFITGWLKLNPPLSDIDLRPLLYLSRDNVISFASYDELSHDGREIMAGLLKAESFYQPMIGRIKSIDFSEAEKILARMKRKTKSEQWNPKNIIQCLHLPKAIPELAPSFIAMLGEIPAKKRPTNLIPLLRNEIWAKELLLQWSQDQNTPSEVKKAINIK